MELKYKINQPYVVSELIDGEVVIMNLKSGNYYSLRNTGVVLWAAIEGQGASRTMLVAKLMADYDVDRPLAENDVIEFIKILCAEDLIAEMAEDSAVAIANEAPTAGRLPYSPPLVDVFADMQDLLLLDPIHDITDAGWPVAKPTRPAN